MVDPSQTTLNRRDFLRRAGQGAALTGGSVFVGTPQKLTLAANTTNSSVTPALPGNPLLVGWAAVSITPDMPVQLAGQFHERVSERVLDPCMATALALERIGDDGVPEQALMIACDLVNLGSEVTEEVRRRVAEQLPSFDGRKLFINASHTHTGPVIRPDSYRTPDPGVMTPEDYADFFCERVGAVAVDAWNARSPGAVSGALTHAAVGFNRIAVYADGSSLMYGKSDRPDFVGVEGGCDHGLELLFFHDSRGELTGAIINIACPSQVVEGQRYVSADFWGPVRAELRRLYGEHFIVYPMTGAAGDQSPRDLVRRGRGEPDMRSEPGMREMARRIVNAVSNARNAMDSPPDFAPLFRHHVEDLSLPVRRVTDEEAAEARAEADSLLAGAPPEPGSRDAAMLRRAQNVLSRFGQQDKTPEYVMKLHVLRLRDAAIATNPFELYLEYGDRIKGRSPAQQTLLAQLTSDRGRYLPTRRAVAGGAYGSRITDTTVGPEGGDLLVESTVEAIQRLWA